jgi:SOS response regulatory protein OraA/RecX
LPSELRLKVEQDAAFTTAYDKALYPSCFSRIEHHAGRETLDHLVREEFKRHTQPSEIHRTIANWPFAGYVTINYDGLLERALKPLTREPWLPVGNSREEARKLSGDASNVVWHVHGSVELPSEASRLVLTAEDYDEFYLEETPVLSQLRALLAQRRVVFFGFGFADSEVMRLLRRIGKLSNPARPIFAFMGGVGGAQRSEERRELLEGFNVDAVPYDLGDGSHGQLQELLGVYSSLVLGRTLKFDFAERPCPSYDPETTGLLVYNELCIKRGARVPQDILGTLLRARILSLLNYKAECTRAEIVDDLNERAKALSLSARSSEEVSSEVQAVLDDLTKAELVEALDTGPLRLTKKGYELVEAHAAKAAFYSVQFKASLVARAEQLLPDQPQAVARVAKAAESFIKDCVRRRALGVAGAGQAISPPVRSYHMVGLLQTLPEFMKQLEARQEAIALGKLVQELLGNAAEMESKFIGMALQAQFGVHLLGYDPPTLQARARELSQTFFLVDSSTLIQSLARSSAAHKSAKMVIDRLKGIGCGIATTTLLADEVVEHINWAGNAVSSEGQVTEDTLAAATGRAGEWLNAFIDGFLEEVHEGKLMDFFHYLGSTLGTRRFKGSPTHADVQQALQKQGLREIGLSDLDGFSEEMFEERDKEQERISDERKLRGTYKHERQTKAEAEALLIIRYLREKGFSCRGQSVSNAYFLSHSRVLDEIARPGMPVTMRPESALQWAATIRPCSVEELEGLTSGLLYEMAERNFEVINLQKLRNVFSGLIDASTDVHL